ncbi:MAG: membrane protein insertion efficiency factor YidD [Planctomycetota bacterium]
MKFLGLWLIRAYQRFISPLYGPVCKYSPSCSHYTYQSIARHGFVAGCVMGFLRICRCNPWALGGPDPVPQKIRWTWRGPVRAGPPPLYDFGAIWAAHGCAGHDHAAPTVVVLHSASTARAASEPATPVPSDRQRIAP